MNQVHGDTVGAELVREGLGQVDDRGVAEAAAVRPGNSSTCRKRTRRGRWYSQDVNHPGLDAYKIVLYRQDDGSWVAEVPAISGCYSLMATREEALAELTHVFDMIVEEYQERGASLPEDTTEIVNA